MHNIYIYPFLKNEKLAFSNQILDILYMQLLIQNRHQFSCYFNSKIFKTEEVGILIKTLTSL